MFKLDLKKAEVALEAGRLDEAAGLLTSSTAVEHAAGQKLKDRLVAELVKRGQRHLADDRLAAAGADAHLAKKLGGHQVDVLALEQQLEARERSVAQSIKDRSLVAAKAQMESLLADGENESVVRVFKALGSVQRSEPSVVELVAQAVSVLVDGAWEDFNRGRLDLCDRATQLIAGLQPVAVGAQQAELLGLLRKAQLALAAARAARYRVAADELKKVKLVATGAAWIDGAIAGLEKCIAGSGEVMNGPLGLLDSDTSHIGMPNHSRPQQSSRRAFTGSPRSCSSAESCRSSILQVDQVGSLLMLAGDHFSIGTTSTKGRPDVALQTEGTPDAVYLRRSGEDYIAACSTPFVVNRKSGREHLLTDGDTIEIGKRGRLTFLKPVAASDTAVLQIKGNKLVRRDIRWIVLVGDAVLFGDSASHFRTPGLKDRVIVRPLVEADGQRKTEFLIHQKGDSDPQLLRSGEQVMVDQCRFSLKASSTAPSSALGHRSQS